MDYKKLIRKRKTRIRILQILNSIPDEIMVKIQYYLKTGRKLDLSDPKRFTEKLQWYKLFYRDSLMEMCVDKYEVRKYVEKCELKNILNDLYGIYNTPEEIDFDRLPDSFVLKDTLGGGGNSIILVRDKKSLDKKKIIKQMWKWVNEPTNKKHPGREWVYEGKKHRIIIEKYIDSNVWEGGLVDYKFFCFNGKAEYLYVISDREVMGKVELGIYDAAYRKQSVQRKDEKPLMRNIKKPRNYNELKNVAEILAQPFPEARIDLYDTDGKIIFGEITFFDGSGYVVFEPDDFDYLLGEKFDLTNIK